MRAVRRGLRLDGSLLLDTVFALFIAGLVGTVVSTAWSTQLRAGRNAVEALEVQRLSAVATHYAYAAARGGQSPDRIVREIRERYPEVDVRSEADDVWIDDVQLFIGENR